MLRELKELFEGRGFKKGNTSTPGDFVIDRAIAEKLGGPFTQNAVAWHRYLHEQPNGCRFTIERPPAAAEPERHR